MVFSKVVMSTTLLYHISPHVATRIQGRKICFSITGLKGLKTKVLKNLAGEESVKESGLKVFFGRHYFGM